MNKKRFIPSPENSLLKGALYDGKDTKLYEAADLLLKYTEEFSIYDQNSVSREAVILHYKDDSSKLVGIELSVVDIGQSGNTFIDCYVKRRLGHLGKVPKEPYALRVKREGNRLYRLFMPVSASTLGMEIDN